MSLSAKVEGNTAQSSGAGQSYKDTDIYKCYKRSPYSSIKHSSYFHAYEDLFGSYRGRDITFVEVGILNGGSLFMWREFFGPKARIIGLDFNPAAKRWEQDGFEIHIGDQAKPEFWQELFAKIGNVDILLDDGGHTFEQQIVTVCEALPHVRDGGLIAVEDTHTSYFKDFGYPTPYSFIEWTKVIVDNINSRFPGINQPFSTLPYKDSVFSLHFYESIVGFKIRRDICVPSHPVSNGAPTRQHEDFRNKDSLIGTVEERSNALSRRLAFLRNMPFLWRTLSAAKRVTVTAVGRYYYKARLRRLRHLF